MSAAATRLCRDDAARRDALRASALNGLDYVEVDEDDRHLLTVVFINTLGDLRGELTAANFRLCGGERVVDPAVTGVEVCADADPERDDCAVLRVEPIGDFCTYTLYVVESQDGVATDRPHPAFDPMYSSLKVDFQVGCPSPLDCTPDERCPLPAGEAPAIDYLAKDYASFRQLLLARLGLLIPGWDEEHEPDLLVTLAELLAYEGDRLSYLQDAVATEAYLETARRRISVRRHARLVDYHVHEGCNARAWVYVETSEDTEWMAPDELFFITKPVGPGPAPPAGTVLSLDDLRHVEPGAYEVFEPMAIGPPPGAARRPTAELARRLKAAGDPVAKLVAEQLSAPARAALDAWDGEEAPPAEVDRLLVAELDRLAHEQALQYAAPFADALDGAEARALREQPLRGEERVALNWVLLHAAFAYELAPPAGLRFVQAHNRIVIHTWGERDCCLAKGSTSATLVDDGLQLVPGDWVVFEEVLDPATGLAEDADPARRHVVRLTEVRRSRDPVLDVAIAEVAWSPEDELPFALCLSAQGPPPACAWRDEISVARGNVVLVDHGRRELDELVAVEVDAIDEPCDGCRPEQELRPARYRPWLDEPELTFAEPLPAGASAAAAFVRDPRAALSQVWLRQVSLQPPRLQDPDPLQRYRNPVPLTAFDPEDLVEPEALAARLRADPPDPVAAYLRGRLDAQTRERLDAGADADALVDGFLRALDAALDDDDPVLAGDAGADGLDAATRALAAEPDLSLDLRRTLRRWVLEQVLDGALAVSWHLVADWTARYDLVESAPDDRHVVVEMTDARRATLRFGDGDLGRRPEAATRFRARYRVGSGPGGNVGADAIAYAVRRPGPLEGIALTPRNPLAAGGGASPEALDEVRRLAPGAIRRDLQRAVTAEDYATLAARDFAAELQGAAAELVWTGSWYEAYVTLDPFDREALPAGLRDAADARLERYRRIGHGLRVGPARYVPLDIELVVCVAPRHDRSHVLAALRDLFTAGLRADGSPGYFHPDRLRFRSSVNVSELIAAAQQVEGVVWSQVTRLQRVGEGDGGELAAGTLAVGPTEIPRVDSRPGFPEHGAITFEMDGWR